MDGEILSISQFTLYADTKKGNRPSYIKAMKNTDANKLYELFNDKLSAKIKIETGVFELIWKLILMMVQLTLIRKQELNDKE